VLISGYLSRDTLCIDIASLHVDDDISLPNALKLTDAELKARTVECACPRLQAVERLAADHHHHHHHPLQTLTSETRP